ncbi:hypothetical protein JCM19052_1648 [Vibrio sp. JCM 19052]|nr:hypothetical protein JCM19052_1648 [Vibrio sp. JCM 19052]
MLPEDLYFIANCLKWCQSESKFKLKNTLKQLRQSNFNIFINSYITLIFNI